MAPGCLASVCLVHCLCRGALIVPHSGDVMACAFSALALVPHSGDVTSLAVSAVLYYGVLSVLHSPIHHCLYNIILIEASMEQNQCQNWKYSLEQCSYGAESVSKFEIVG